MNTENTDPKMWQLLTEYGNARAAQAIAHNTSPTLDEPFTDETARVDAAWAAVWEEVETRRKNFDAAWNSIEQARKKFSQLRGLLGTAVEWVS